ncbi:MAG: NrfD/PsrC family molybdoenzyme membrane anchor subunit [Bryobacteraceae bacterium]|nr:NrfD/PsrC family molybdoenzyme membrane anchor subunit [Bryobacteraceae bacterium]
MDKLETTSTSLLRATGPAAAMGPGHSYATITDKISAVPIEMGWPRFWIIGFVIAFSIVQLLALSTTGLLAKGTGVWGINIPVGWGFAIINFVWWIGIGHAGTLISAILLLLKQQWRMSISRFAESMTIFAVMCAAMFPVLHTGRPWLAAYWLFPYPNTMAIWPQPRSPLEWDVFAVSTYGTVSIIFWYIGLIPDLATMRDKAKTAVGQRIYGMFALGWRGSARHWNHYEIASIILAGLSTPLVLSVHTVVSFDFATGLIPGWHTTIFPPYFVAGAIYSGFAMVLTLAIPMRAFYNMKDFITDWHLENMAKVMLATGLIVAYGYGMEAFMAWYSGNPWEMYAFKNRAFGPMGWAYWALILFNILIPQLLWIKGFRTSPFWLVVISICINIGMWLERFVIVVTSLYRDFLPSSWGTYAPTVWDWGLYIGTMGFFLMMMLLFVRGLPAMPMFELRVIMPKKEGSH